MTSGEGAQSDAAVYVRLFGGLGNQMFQYAAGLEAASHHNCPLKIDISWYECQEKREYLLDRWVVDVQIAEKDELAQFARRGFAGWARPRFREYFLPFKKLRIYRQPTPHYDTDFLQVAPPVQLQGYFQSELFFSSVSARLRAEFQPRDPLSESSQRFLCLIEAAVWPVALHVRRGDYVNHAKVREVHGTCSADYYRRARRIMDSLSGERAHYFVFSDEPENAMEVLQDHDLSRLTIVTANDERPWEDMHLMAACRDNVIANSSFSWWGAWLNAHPDKTVIAPRRWFQREAMLQRSLVDLIPDGWVTL